MPRRWRVSDLPPRAARTRLRRRSAAMLVALCAVAAGATACTSAPPVVQAAPVPGALPGARPDPQRLPTAVTHPPRSATSVLTGTPAVLAAAVARQLFVSAPVVVVADASRPAKVAVAARLAHEAHAPLLLTAHPATHTAGEVASGTPSGGTAGTGPPAVTASRSARPPGAVPTVTEALRAEISELHPRAVLVAGMAPGEFRTRLPGIHVVTNLADLPATGAPAPSLGHVVVLAHRDDGSAGAMAASATAEVAGARLVRVRGDDPRSDPAAIAALSAIRPQQVLAIGAGFGPANRLASRVAVAATGVQLPGGGQVLFPGHRLVALYGHPGAPALGALGQQDLSASIARARRVAAAYRPLSRVPVTPAFEIIATVAQGSPGPDGDYSYESSVASLRPWVERASAAGMYVVLDLQAGRASLLSQARRYAPLLRLPNVGLALDPEWKLQPDQLPLRQIGSVGIGSVNRVASWLAALTAHHHLPQKLLVLHQFRLSMIRDEQHLDTRYDDLAIVVHMDGQGTPEMKQTTWNAITRAAPPGVFFGWKNFYVMDHPVLTPNQTMAKRPRPVMISYQ